MKNSERLTYKTQGDATRGSHYCTGPGIRKDDVVQRLGEYEDTGLSPGEICAAVSAAADIQPVVYCKDCKYRTEHHYEMIGEVAYTKYSCKFTHYSMSDHGFCSFGSKADGGADDENS